MDKLVFVYLDEATAQSKLGWIGGKTGIWLENAEKIAEATDGNIYINASDELDFKRGFSEFRDSVKEIILEKAFESYRKGEISSEASFSVNGIVQKIPVVNVAELEDLIREAYVKFVEEKKAEEEREARLGEQRKAFRESKAFPLYNNYLHRYLNDDDTRRYKELLDKVNYRVISDEELAEVISELEDLYEKAKRAKLEQELEEAQKRVDDTLKRLNEVEEKYKILREFIDENYSDEFREWYANKKKEELEQQIDEEVDEILNL